MPNGPNIFFVAPDGDLIVSGSTDGSDTPNDLFGGNAVANSANRGALSSFVIGNPTTATSIDLRINHSGGIDVATYVWKSGASADVFTNYYGEPDRRWEWDVHSPLEVDPTNAFSSASKRYWRTGGTATDIPTSSWQGCCLENINKEFLYVVEPFTMCTKIGVYYRDLSNKESGWSAAEITGLKDGTIFNGSYGSVFAVCTHTDNKIKLALIFDQDIDIYESSNGIDFTLVCELALSRFCGFRLRTAGDYQSLKLASSGAYLKLIFVNDDLYESLTSEEVIFHEQREVFANGEFLGREDQFTKRLYGDITSSDNLPIVANQDQKYERTSFYIGSITSPDGGATWSLSDLPSYSGSNLPCIAGHGFTLTGLNDGSGQFILMFMVDEILNYVGATGNIYIPHTYHGAISVGNSPFIVHKNLELFNLLGSGTPYLGCSNDWIWFISASEFSSILESWTMLNNRGTNNTGKYLTNVPTFVRDNQVYYIRLNSDPSNTVWTKLGSSDVYLDPISVSNAYSAVNSLVEAIDESVTTGSVGSMHHSFFKGNIYSCGASMAWARMVYSERIKLTNNNICYSRFSGWQTLPPNETNTDLLSIDGALQRSERKPFLHQPSKVLAKPEFCYMWGYPTAVLANGQTYNSSTQSSPASSQTLWFLQRDSGSFITGSDAHKLATTKGLRFFSPSTSSGTKSYIYFVDPAVPDKSYYAPNATGTTFDIKPPDSLLIYNDDFPQIVWGGRPRLDFSTYHGCNISFVIGNVSIDAAFVDNTAAWTDTNNDIGGFTGVKMRTYVSGKNNVDTTNELAAMEVHIQFTSTEVRVYLPYSLSYSGNREIIKITPDVSTYGTNPFRGSFWECRLAINTQFFDAQNTHASLSKPRFHLCIRKYGTNDWLTSSVVKDIDFWDKSATISGNEHKAIQFIACGIHKHTAASSDEQSVKFKFLRVNRGSDLGQYNMFASITDSSKIDAVRGRNVSSLPCLIDTKQSIVWGGASGYEADTYSYETKSNYEALNAIKYPSPQIQYRTIGSASDVKSGTASLVASLPDADRSVGNNAFLHSGIALFGINAEKVLLEYDNNSSFSSVTTIFESDTKVATGRIDEKGHNNFIRVSFDGDTLHSNDSNYSQTKNNTYYVKFSTLSAGVTPDINGLSFSIKKQSGGYLYLDIPSFDLDSTASGLGVNLIGTTIQIFSDTMLSIFDKTVNRSVLNPKYMRVTLKNHLGTDPYYKLGSLTCGMTYGFQNVPMNWEHNQTVTGNVKSFQSRSGIRWGYEDGPSVSSYSATIMGDVFEQERSNIVKILQNATEFNNRPVAMVFDDGKHTSPTVSENPSLNIKMYVDPNNILYGTFSNQLQLVNAGWGYDQDKQKWVPIGDMQITVTETV